MFATTCCFILLLLWQESCYLQNVDFVGGDLVPESQKFKTENASACCDACVHFKVDKFCQAWVWKESGTDPHRCYLKSGAALSHKTKATGMIAGYPDGIAPPSSAGSYYNTSRTVKISIGSVADGRVAGGTAKLTMINSTCANPKALWEGSMKSVTWPSAAQLTELKTASEMCEEEVAVVADEATGALTVEVTLEAYASARLTVSMA